MEASLEPRSLDAVRRLIAKGVDIPNPLSVDIGPEVDLDRISGTGVRIEPGCRIAGARTVISDGVRLGAEGPVTLEDCQLGPKVALKGGYAANAVFLAGSSMGLGHHVREGTLLEEEASGAHTVGLKQTILMPYVTLGSLINFCDCLMAGGTSRKDHSEVGSSYIHFNFTPEGDKATPSLFGEVPRGVLLRERPIFLGGQGGTVGPVGVAYGTIVGAGSVLRSDVLAEGQLVIVGPPPSMNQPYPAGAYRAINRLVGRNIEYLAQLRALRAWYASGRRPFFAAQPLGTLVHDAALALLDGAWRERASRLRSMVAKVEPTDDARRVLRERLDEVCEAIGGGTGEPAAPGAVIEELERLAASGVGYLEAIAGLPDGVRAEVQGWLGSIVDAAWQQVGGALPQVRRPIQLPAGR